MPSYSISFPNNVIAAMKADLAELGEGLTGKSVPVAWIRLRADKPLRQYLKQAIGAPDDLESARIAAEQARAREAAARATAEAQADVAADAGVAGIA
jgi:hypothetical protein